MSVVYKQQGILYLKIFPIFFILKISVEKNGIPEIC